MDEALSTYIKNDRPFLGICLGLQVLFESSEENGPGQFSNTLFFVKLWKTFMYYINDQNLIEFVHLWNICHGYFPKYI